jgi:hypothetical protein
MTSAGCLSLQARRMSRMNILIATQSTGFAVLSIALDMFRNLIATFLPLVHLVMACVSMAVHEKSLQAANLKAVVPSDTEFSIWSSILCILSVEQTFVSLGVAWEAMTEYTWSDASEGVAAFCFLLAAVASLAAAGTALLAGTNHLLSNENALVRVAVSITLTPVMAFVESCIQEYVHACMKGVALKCLEVICCGT